MTEFVRIRPKTFVYLIDGYDDDDYNKNKIINKKAKGTRKCVIKRILMFENYKDCLFNDKVILQQQQGFRSDNHKVYTKNFNKIALNSNDDKRLQTFDTITKYPHGTNIFKVCESEMLKVCKAKGTLKILSKKTVKAKCL